jgi:hypothetical protein
MGRNKIDRTGEENCNSFGTLMKIVECKSAINIIVEFQDEYKASVHTSYQAFKRGNVKNPYDREVFDVGYIGAGKYKTSENGKKTKVYEIWKNMMQRCYDPYYINKYPTYIDCYVCELWHNFQKIYKTF